MKNFVTVNDVMDPEALVQEALQLKKNLLSHDQVGKHKTLGLIFMNPSLRTRLSTQKAAMNLGMQVMVLNIDKEGWALELNEGSIMNGATVEHVKDAAAVIGQYCDVVGLRCFPSLKNKEEDYQELVLTKFMTYCQVPMVSLESATRHPLQSLADLMTIRENWQLKRKPKVVLSWAPHVKPLPQAVANSFSEWMLKADVDFVITHPEGYELAESFTKGAKIIHDQQVALQDADFVYVKNWSAFKDYGKMPEVNESWLLTREKLSITNQAKVMHCLPVRRNVELSDEVLDSENALVLQQAANRVIAAQIVLKKIINNE